MQMKYTEEKLNTFSKETLIQLFLTQQEQLSEIDGKLQLVLEQLAVMNQNRFGRKTEQMPVPEQLAFTDVDGELVLFNEAEVLAALDEREKETTVKKRPVKEKGKREEDLSGIPVVKVEHYLTEKELEELFGKAGWKQLPDEIYKRYRFIPAKVEVEEHHVGVYASKEGDTMKKAPHPACLLRGSLVSPSLEAAVLNGKYINAVPFARLEKEFGRYGLAITRQNMANWTIECADRYLAVFYDYLHKYIYKSPVIHADETHVLVRKDGREAGSKSYMWVYRTGEKEKKAVILYEYQKTRKADHPERFLKDYKGICVTDGYQVYHKLGEEKEGLTIAGCWAHARRRYDEAVKALPSKSRKSSIAWQALEQIQMIYHVDNTLKELKPEERKKRRQSSVKPLVEAYFAWVKEKKADGRISEKSKAGRGLSYSINQEKYLKVFLEDGNVPMDNNAAERAIKNFCIGRKNWLIIDTIRGAQSSAIIYSIAETAKANNLKPYEYFEYLLEEISQHMEDTDLSFCENLLPWSTSLPEKCRKPEKNKTAKRRSKFSQGTRYLPLTCESYCTAIFLCKHKKAVTKTFHCSIV